MVGQHTVENQMLMGVRTGISPKHSMVAGSFSASYPAILSAPKAGLNSIQVRASVDFGTMRTFEEWDKGGVLSYVFACTHSLNCCQEHVLLIGVEAWQSLSPSACGMN